jgi:hypothetical protein
MLYDFDAASSSYHHDCHAGAVDDGEMSLVRSFEKAGVEPSILEFFVDIRVLDNSVTAASKWRKAHEVEVV